MKHKKGHTYEELPQGDNWQQSVAAAVKQAVEAGWTVDQVFLPQDFDPPTEFEFRHNRRSVCVPLVCHADVAAGSFIIDKYK